MMELLKECKVTRVKDAVAAGSSNVTDASIIDMLGFDRVAFLVAFGTLTSTAVTGIKVQQSDASDMSGAEDIATSALAIPDTDSNKDLMTDIIKPTKRYIRVIITRGTANAVVNGAWAFQYGAKHPGVTQASTFSATESIYSPTGGTA